VPYRLFQMRTAQSRHAAPTRRQKQGFTAPSTSKFGASAPSAVSTLRDQDTPTLTSRSSNWLATICMFPVDRPVVRPSVTGSPMKIKNSHQRGAGGGQPWKEPAPDPTMSAALAAQVAPSPPSCRHYPHHVQPRATRGRQEGTNEPTHGQSSTPAALTKLDTGT
jgi:hypothetical protein